MALNTLYVTGSGGGATSNLTTTTNPNPNTLGLINPFPNPFVGNKTVVSGWTSQAKPAFMPDVTQNNGGYTPFFFNFVPSAGSSASFQITPWVWDRAQALWALISNQGTRSYSGQASYVDVFNLPLFDALFFQINTLSSGILVVSYDNTIASAL